MKSVSEPVELGVFIPEMPNGASHHVISRGQHPQFYKPSDLRDKGPGKTAWVDAFEKILIGVYWVLDGPVPYAFKTPDGLVRSLDAGCVKMLINRKPAELALICDSDGYIEAVQPEPVMIDRYLPIKTKLMARVLTAEAGI